MKRLSLILGLVAALFAFNSPAWAASPHFMSDVPECHVSADSVTCDASNIAGVGNTNAVATLNVWTVVSVECHNPGTNEKWVPPHDTVNQSSATTGKLEPKNGRLDVPQLTAYADTSLPAKLCPNKRWDAIITGTTLSYDYTITFLTKPDPSVFFHLAG